MSPNISISQLARSTFCQRPIRFPPERCAFSPYRLPSGNPYVLETFQTYRLLVAAVNPLKSQDFHLISTAGEFTSRKANSRLENSLRRARQRASARNGRKIRRTPTRKTKKTLKIAWRLCFSRKPFRDLVPECEPRKRGQIRGVLHLMPKAAARIQRADFDTQSLSSTLQTFIPELLRACKRGIKEVT